MRVLLPSGDGAAVAYLAWLAYPYEEQRRDRFFMASLYLVAKGQGIQPKRMPTALSALKGGPARMREIVNSGYQVVIEKRCAAAYMFLRLNEPRKLADGKMRAFEYAGADNVTDAARYWHDESMRRRIQTKHQEDRNSRERVWRESLPVLPMMLGFMFTPETLAAYLSPQSDRPTIKVDGPIERGGANLIAQPDWAERAVKAANLVPADPEFFIVPRIRQNQTENDTSKHEG